TAWEYVRPQEVPAAAPLPDFKTTTSGGRNRDEFPSDSIRTEADVLTIQFAARARAMSDCLAVVPWPQAIRVLVIPYFLSISPTAAVPSVRSIGPRAEMRSVT